MKIDNFLKKIIVILFVALTLQGCTSVNVKENLSKRIKASNKEGQSDIVYAIQLSFDRKSGEIKYTLPEDALVRVRIGLEEGGPLLVTLLDWEFRTKGNHVEVWNGKDPGGVVDFGRLPNLSVVMVCRKPVVIDNLQTHDRLRHLFRPTLRCGPPAPEIDYPQTC